MKAAYEEMLAVVNETGIFLKRLNWKWFKDLEALIAEGTDALETNDVNKLQAWSEKVDFCMNGENQLGSLFVSAPDKREAFKNLKLKWNERLAKTKSLT